MYCDPLFLYQATRGELYGDSSHAGTSASIDSRTLQQGQYFVALRGKHVDGHSFVEQALQQGAVGAVIERSAVERLTTLLKRFPKAWFLAVDDTYTALLDAARAWRDQLSCPVIGITGSVGKTTTKEMVATILRNAGLRITVSAGNNNTLLGSALTLLSGTREDQALVCEVGISRQGEMRDIAAVLRPTTAAITLIGHGHMEGLGSLHDIAQEKRAIFSSFTDENVGIVNGDQDTLSSISYAHPVLRFGVKMTNQVQARKINVSNDSVSFILKLYGRRYSMSLPVPHVGAVHNALAAASIATLLGIPDEKIIEGLRQTCVVSGRFQALSCASRPGTIINDCYNANPESMKEALLAFDRLESPFPKIAVIGDMLELGVSSPFWHRQVGRLLRKTSSIHRVIFVGEHVKHAAKTVPFAIAAQYVPTWREAVPLVEHALQDGAALLVKGSRGMELNNLVEAVVAQ